MKTPRGIVWLLLCGFLIGALAGYLFVWNGHTNIRVQDVYSTPDGKSITLKPLPLADFELDSLDGEIIRLSEFRGRPVVVNFWATWCDPCKEEMPLLELVYTGNSNRLVVIGVNAQEDPIVVKPFVENYQLTFPIVLDQNGEMEKRYAVRGYPTTFFIDADGVLKAEYIGQLNDALLMNYLKLIGAE